MSILVSGSFVFDNILCFSGKFQNEILPDKVHMLNVSFETPELRREYGGCAGNIAYNINLLGGKVIPIGTLGSDGADYLEHFKKQGIICDFLEIISTHHTAQAFIITDQENNQITAFHTGAMKFAENFGIPLVGEDIKIAIVSPNSKGTMIRHAQELFDLKIPFIFDPGQAMGLFTGDELRKIITQAQYLAVNDYESQVIAKKTGLDVDKIAEGLKGLIITKGGNGSTIYTGNQVVNIPANKPEKIVDPTGCGDSYRGGVLYALSEGADLVEACRLGSKMGALKISVAGGQNHGEVFKEKFHHKKIKIK